MPFSYILWPFGILVIWYIFPFLVCLGQEKSGNPVSRHIKNEFLLFPRNSVLQLTADQCDRKQGCQIFVRKTYQKYTKSPQNIPNHHKTYQITTKTYQITTKTYQITTKI
jgi:hypothetical protein